MNFRILPALLCLGWAAANTASAQPDLEARLKAESVESLARAARMSGDAKSGAIAFYQPYMACARCHIDGQPKSALGPDLSKYDREVTDAELVEAILDPSKTIREGFRSVTVNTLDGRSVTGLVVADSDTAVTLRQDPTTPPVAVAKADIDERFEAETSIMPQGLSNQLAGRQQFLDLLKYLMEIRDGGAARARELEPPPALYAARPLPEYESQIDHAGMIASLDRAAFRRGEAIYQRVCANCHGTHDAPGSLPTALRFAEGQFKNGGDPHAMYRTLTRGYGMMVPQSWMVPRQKYDVIHYVREAFLKRENPSQYAPVTDDYLAALPQGDTFGPEPSNIVPWTQMDYGPWLINTYEVGNDGTNFAYKGIAARLDPGPGGVSRGRSWMAFDHDTLRLSAAWTGEGFINWKGIHFNGEHAIHPRLVGDVHLANPSGPGWANPETGSLDDPRLKGRDGRHYGPLPREWAHYRGLYAHGDRVVVKYTVGNTEVLESPGKLPDEPSAVFVRSFEIGPRDRDMVMLVATHPAKGATLRKEGELVRFGPAVKAVTPAPGPVEFNGSTFLQMDEADAFDMTGHDFTVIARVRTKQGGTILAKTEPGDEWVPDGKVLFVRGGRLCYDIGWVGVVTSRRRIDDGEWHDVALSWEEETGIARLFIDGKREGEKELRPKSTAEGQVVRVGFAAPNFPGPHSFFTGDIESVKFFNRALGTGQFNRLPEPVAAWRFTGAEGDRVPDTTDHGHSLTVIHGGATAPDPTPITAGLAPTIPGTKWFADGQRLCLRIPAGAEPLRFNLWTTTGDKPVTDPPPIDLSALTEGGPRRWLDEVKTEVVSGTDDGPFAVDILTWPAANPWNCRVRLTGFDFYPGTDRAAVCAWDGSVWLVDGLSTPKLTWRRIASGLFQPLGLKIIDGKIYVGCRDQICILHDLNGDGETDFYENFNNDHQVTDHFHEFAMGLQSDAEGNLYYAKSARHALTALVPHHGTLLRVSQDGSKTDILATGFRAANGVCLNPDGTFFVTDQEGHWTPKNRINWVKEGGFYGNMYGYHDRTDSSDDAMEPPLCWITNEFDRSPAELLWVDSPKWGPLQGSLLNMSYGYGKIYVVPHERIGDRMQGGMCELPIPQFPTGVMRGRFRPEDGQLYCCGMFAWAGNQQQPGGFYRVRYTGKPVHLPTGLTATDDGLTLTFSGELDRESAGDVSNYSLKQWSLKRTANYGSQHIDERPVKVTAAEVSADGKQVKLKIDGLEPTWCMEIRYDLTGSGRESVRGTIHNTIHETRTNSR